MKKQRGKCYEQQHCSAPAPTTQTGRRRSLKDGNKVKSLFAAKKDKDGIPEAEFEDKNDNGDD